MDVKYSDAPPHSLKELFYQRRNPQGSIFNESGVWRFRELLNFCEIDTEDLDQCSQHLVSLDGAEGRQSKPYHMSKVAKFVDEHSLTFPVLLDLDGIAERIYPSFTIPFTYVIDKKGRIAARVDGAKNWSSNETFAALDILIKR